MCRKKLRKKIIAGSALVLLAGLSGCHPVGPDYQPPQVAIPQQWQSPMLRGLGAEQADPNMLANWWQSFNDPILNDLVSRAVAGNLDLKTAYSRLRQSRAVLTLEEVDQYPTLNSSGGATWTSRDSVESDSYNAGLDSRWELDIFGGTRRSIEAAKADLESVRADLRDALVSLTSEVALNYIQVRQSQQQLNAVQNSLELQSQTHEITCWQNQAGIDDELAVFQSLYNLESSRAQIPAINSTLNKACNRIAILLGEQPGMIHQQLAATAAIPSLPLSVSVGLPAETIRRRADIRKAEADLIAQTARVGAATADLYPKLSLSGSIAVNGSSFHQLSGNLSDSSAWTFSGGPQLSWNVFDAGAIRQNIKIQSIRQEQALLNYEQTILTALEEVENALTSYASEQQRRDNLNKAMAASQSAALLAKQQYEAGLADFSDVLESQRTLLSFQNQLVESDGTMAGNLVRLYKALGGGWQEQSLEIADNK